MDFFRNSSAPQQKKNRPGPLSLLDLDLGGSSKWVSLPGPEKIWEPWNIKNGLYMYSIISVLIWIIMDYVLSFIVVFFHISMYGFHVWLVISGYIHKSEGNLDHMLNGTMKSLTNPGCFMKLLNHPGRSVLKKKVSEALSPTIQVVIQSHMLHVWNVYQHLGKYTIHGAYGVCFS